MSDSTVNIAVGAGEKELGIVVTGESRPLVAKQHSWGNGDAVSVVRTSLAPSFGQL